MTKRENRHFICLDDFDKNRILRLFDRADSLKSDLASKKVVHQSLNGFVVAMFFAEPSTRTALSFQTATQRLGGTTIHNPVTSLVKGESLSDTLRILSGYADMIVLRHPGENTEELARDVHKPVVNAGDGGNEHPTQALIDLFTIKQRVGQLENLKVGIGFDPLHSRSIRSFCLALSKFENNEIVVVSPEECSMPADQVNQLKSRGLKVTKSKNVSDLFECETIYLNRFQRERFADPTVVSRYIEQYTVTAAQLQDATKVKHVLDPLPRVGELDPKVDTMAQAAYFEQSDNGVPVRMALLESLALGSA